MEATQPPPSALPNKLFLSGSDLHTPVEGAHSPARPPVNGTSSSSVGTFAVKAGLAQMLKICPPFTGMIANGTGVLSWMLSSNCSFESRDVDATV